MMKGGFYLLTLMVGMLIFSTHLTAQVLKGDINEDGKVDVSDVSALVDICLVQDSTTNPQHTLNLGATYPEDHGLFYAWGETKGYAAAESTFGWDSYSLCDGTAYHMTKYCCNESRGNVDNLAMLLPEDDAATATLGNDWHIPTDLEFTELRTHCTWTWTSLHGINGYVVSHNGNAIFLPVTGNCGQGGYGLPYGGFYWSSTLLDNSYQAWRIQFYDSRVTRFRDNRFYGECIRPVKIAPQGKLEENLITTQQPNI